MDFKCFAAIALAMSAGVLLQAAPATIIDGGSVHALRCPAGKEYISQVTDGNPGKAFRLVNPTDKKILYHSGLPKAKIPSAAAQVIVRMDVKGTGKGEFGFLAYNQKHRIIYPPKTTVSFTIDSKDKWVKKEFTYTPQAGSLYSRVAVYVIPQVRALKGTDIVIDNLSIEFVEKTQIVLED